MNKCPKCDSEYKTGETECQKCGIIFEKYLALQKKQTAKTQSLMMKCKVCDKQISKNATACPFCGEPNKVENITKSSKEMIKCEKCGAAFHKSSKECPKCTYPNKKANPLSPSQVLIVLVAAFLMLWFVTTNNSSSKSKTHPKPKEVKEVKKLENPNCHLDLQCWGDKHHIAASIRCTGHVEKLAKYSHKWTDGILESKFSQFRWINMDKGIVTYIGDKIQFQNGFGAWQNYTYECDYDPNSDIVIDVRARPTHK